MSGRWIWDGTPTCHMEDWMANRRCDMWSFAYLVALARGASSRTGRDVRHLSRMMGCLNLFRNKMYMRLKA